MITFGLDYRHYIEFEKKCLEQKCESTSGAQKYKNQNAARVMAVNKTTMLTDISELQSEKPPAAVLLAEPAASAKTRTPAELSPASTVWCRAGYVFGSLLSNYLENICEKQSLNIDVPGM